MKKFVIVIGSDDGKNIVNAHMGEAKSFYLYDIFEDGSVKFLGKKANETPEEEGEHGAMKKMQAVMAILHEAEVVIGKELSPNFRNIAAKTKIEPIVIKLNKISQITRKVSDNFDMIYALVEKRKNGERAKEILIFGE